MRRKWYRAISVGAPLEAEENGTEMKEAKAFTSLTLCDLAGSEKFDCAAKKEGRDILESLLALGEKTHRDRIYIVDQRRVADQPY